MLGSRGESCVLRLVVVGLYSLFLSSLVQAVIVIDLYAIQRVDATMYASLILAFGSVSQPARTDSWQGTNISSPVTTLATLRLPTLITRSPPQKR